MSPRACEEELDAYEREVYEMNFVRETPTLTLTLSLAVSSAKKWRNIDGISLDVVLPTRPLPTVRFVRAAEGKTLWQAQSRAFFYVREDTPYAGTVFSQEKRERFILYFNRNRPHTALQIYACIEKLGGHIPRSFCEYLSSIITIHLLAGSHDDDNNDDDAPF